VLIVLVLEAPGRQPKHTLYKKHLNYVCRLGFVSEPTLIRPMFIGKPTDIRATWPAATGTLVIFISDRTPTNISPICSSVPHHKHMLYSSQTYNINFNRQLKDNIPVHLA
jgi:hypothetical protein